MKTKRRSSIKEETSFEGPTIEVARRLIGATLIRKLPADNPDAGTELAGRIVETEAYLPLVDPACHGYRGPTPRNAAIFGRPGNAYVYFIYGNHYCLNVTTESAGVGAAVLIRALEALRGVEAMRRRRPGVKDSKLLSGPGNLCRAMAIDRSCDGIDLSNDELLRIEMPRPRRSSNDDQSRIVAAPRIGLRVAADWLLRFYDQGSASVSKRAR